MSERSEINYSYHKNMVFSCIIDSGVLKVIRLLYTFRLPLYFLGMLKYFLYSVMCQHVDSTCSVIVE